jgi:hypothetical protein
MSPIKIEELEAAAKNYIPRHVMPQIPQAKLEEFSKYLKTKGVKSKILELPTHLLKPTQTEFNQEKVDTLKKDPELSKKALIVSQKGKILDGHHRYLAHKELKSPNIKCLYCKLPMLKLIKYGHMFDGSFTKTVNESSRFKLANIILNNRKNSLK